jgi:hypothetical protein
MQLRNLVYIIVFLVTSFILNIFFYFISPDYRSFLRTIKADNIKTNKEEKIENNKITYLKESKNIDKQKSYYLNNTNLTKKDISNINSIKSEDLKEIKVEYTTIV